MQLSVNKYYIHNTLRLQYPATEYRNMKKPVSLYRPNPIFGRFWPDIEFGLVMEPARFYFSDIKSGFQIRNPVQNGRILEAYYPAKLDIRPQTADIST